IIHILNNIALDAIEDVYFTVALYFSAWKRSKLGVCTSVFPFYFSLHLSLSIIWIQNHKQFTRN
ncbi:MAG TPA: hypothetical protein VJ799_05535, partial [Nitrososphaeraceae archaeon]|nr:hypothetical protein [Nitrososphaeraceae archaeon]